MAAELNAKEKAWTLFDRIVAHAAPENSHRNPWVQQHEGILCYEPDVDTLSRLLGVPLYLNAESRTGVPALALDVWLSYELRRAGFDYDAVWPRPIHPRILPKPIASLLKALPAKERAQLHDRLTRNSAITGVTSSNASILGKNYLKQIDVIMTDWATGPELLISTKRMDSSYGKNAPNRIEESYGDAKNLRLRHPLAAVGFVFGLRSDILQEEPDTAEWLMDLLIKLGREEDAYHATCLIMMEYSDAVNVNSHAEGLEPRTVTKPVTAEEAVTVSAFDADLNIEALPPVKILSDKVPPELSPGRFLSEMVTRVLDTTPVTMHREARRRRREAANSR